ncbi:hypothetical protein PVAND_001113 [Polypedilum vanderplanki]|uniref:Ionotropic receptor n=1 Tax=Polypedilum vanderplanki TaxID=319348 RepID=A0A9J6BLY2_POLVA|nr:hypothetical protein PVAND_001113 [Polypedilum vanderplanki]
MLIIFLFLLGNCHQSLSILVTDFQSYQSFSTDSTQTVSKAISDVIREFFIATDIQFNFIIYNETSKHINDIIDETQKQLSQYLSSIKIKHFTNITKRIHDLDKSVVIFIKTITAFEYFQVSRHNAVEKVKYLIYIEEIKNFQLLNEKIKINRPPEFDIRSPVNFRYFEFFIISNESSINIIANVLYSETKCEIFEPKILNSFDNKKQKWEQNLKNIEFFGNFHGCMLKFIAPMDHLFYINECEKSFYGPQVKITDKIHLASTGADSYDLFYENAKLQGLTYEIIQTMAQKYNFTPHYNLYKDRGLSPTRNFFTKSLRTNFLMTTILDLRYIRKKFHLSQPLGTQDFFCLVSLNDFYTNYDKMLLPFDSATWMLILCTYGLTFGIIFGLRFSPEWIRITVTGKGIKGPGYNALAIFMGISQLKLPTETFCRSILIIYIWFCLMIRTCWQSKMFEFMTSDMRKPLPASLEDLIEMNYAIILRDEEKFPLYHIIDDKIRFLTLNSHNFLSKASIFNVNILNCRIKGPGYNALAIFMGISQLKLPTETFCRSILIIYIWFCLMIRTCWQSKMFEFMTSDMRKPLPKSLEDLKEMNYTFIFDESYLYALDDYFHGKEKPIMMVVDTFKFYNLYQSSLEGETNSKYAFYMSNELYMFLKSRFKTSLPILENEGATKTFSYIIQKNSIIGSQINEIIDRLIEAGIAKQVYEHGLWYNYRPVDDEIEDSRRILSMSDLEFGFVIFLGVLSVSIMVFICEVSYIFLRKQFIEFLGLCEILRAIYVRLQNYNDRWYILSEKC